MKIKNINLIIVGISIINLTCIFISSSSYDIKICCVLGILFSLAQLTNLSRGIENYMVFLIAFGIYGLSLFFPLSVKARVICFFTGFFIACRIARKNIEEEEKSANKEKEAKFRSHAAGPNITPYSSNHSFEYQRDLTNEQIRRKTEEYEYDI